MPKVPPKVTPAEPAAGTPIEKVLLHFGLDESDFEIYPAEEWKKGRPLDPTTGKSGYFIYDSPFKVGGEVEGWLVQKARSGKHASIFRSATQESWEYDVFQFACLSQADFLREMNEQGALGWEVAHMISLKGFAGQALMKRRKVG